MDERSILVLDPSCGSAHGHHLKSLEDLIEASAPAKPILMVGQVLPPEVFSNRNGVSIFRIFTTTVYDEPGIGPRPGDRKERRKWKLRRALANAKDSAGRTLAQLKSVLSADAAIAAQDWEWSKWPVKWPALEADIAARVATTPIRHIVVPSSDVELISALVDLRARVPALANAEIHARPFTASPSLARLRAGSKATPAYRALMEQRMKGVFLYVETAAMQRHYLETYGLKSDVWPYLIAPTQFDDSASNRSRGPVVFGYFGSRRNEKGFDRLLPILTEAARSRRPSDPAIVVLIQATDVFGVAKADTDDLRKAFAALTGPGLAIEIIAAHMTDAEYGARFASLDATLLPYTGERYKFSGSGILCEAIAMGKAAIMAKGMSFSDICSAENAIEAGSDAEFAAAILAMARDIECYRRGAAARAVTYAAEVKSCELLERLK